MMSELMLSGVVLFALTMFTGRYLTHYDSHITERIQAICGIIIALIIIIEDV